MPTIIIRTKTKMLMMIGEILLMFIKRFLVRAGDFGEEIIVPLYF